MFIELDADLGLFLFPLQNASSNLDACWQRDFERRYIELEELGRGRFSVVRRCQVHFLLLSMYNYMYSGTPVSGVR